MIQLLAGSFLLSLIHASIPNHWLPVVAISNTEKWSRGETLWITALAGTAHTVSTVLIGIIIGFIGYKLSSVHQFITSIIAPLILVIIGFVYIIIDLKNSHSHANPLEINTLTQKSKLAIIASLALAMFFSPCIEIEAYYFSAGSLGWKGILAVSAVYIAVTVSGMILLVDLGLKGVKKIRWNFLEHHENICWHGQSSPHV